MSAATEKALMKHLYHLLSFKRKSVYSILISNSFYFTSGPMWSLGKNVTFHRFWDMGKCSQGHLSHTRIERETEQRQEWLRQCVSRKRGTGCRWSKSIGHNNKTSSPSPISSSPLAVYSPNNRSPLNSLIQNNKILTNCINALHIFYCHIGSYLKMSASCNTAIDYRLPNKLHLSFF